MSAYGSNKITNIYQIYVCKKKKQNIETAIRKGTLVLNYMLFINIKVSFIFSKKTYFRESLYPKKRIAGAIYLFPI